MKTEHNTEYGQVYGIFASLIKNLALNVLSHELLFSTDGFFTCCTSLQAEILFQSSKINENLNPFKSGIEFVHNPTDVLSRILTLLFL